MVNTSDKKRSVIERQRAKKYIYKHQATKKMTLSLGSSIDWVYMVYNMVNNVLQKTLFSILMTIYLLNVFNFQVAAVCLVAYMLCVYFFTNELAMILFVSIAAAYYIVHNRVLQSSSSSTKLYSTIALSMLLSVFFIITLNGTLEPYQAAILAMIFYIIHGRFRTSSLVVNRD